jgi:hypothetical protein
MNGTDETMEVFVNGVTERRRIEGYTRDEGRLMPGMLVPNPVHHDNEVVMRTISGETHILKT